MSKERITVTIDKEVLEWLDNHIMHHIFANRSHGFEFLIAAKMKEESDGGKR